MAEQVINGVPQPPFLPPGYRFHPTSSELFRYYLYDRVTKGSCQWNIVSDTDILAVPPWHLPGMDSNENEGYYFYERERKSKSAGSKGNNRIIKVDKQAFWKVNFSDDVWEEGMLWGKKNTLNYFNGPNAKTDWLMYEFVLDPSLAEGNDGNVVLCKVYKKKDSKEGKRGRGLKGSNIKEKGKSCLQGSSDGVAEIEPLHDINSGQALKRRRIMNACFPQLNQKTQFAVGALSSAASPYIEETHHSEAAIQPSFSTEPHTEGIHPAEVATSSTINHCIYAAPVDDPKLYYQPPAAFDSAKPYIEATHPAAVEPCTINHSSSLAEPCMISYSSPAEPCTIAASSSNSIAPTDDRNVHYTETEWEQEIQQYLSFDSTNQFNDCDEFDEEYFAPFFNI
ncbi:hypothetical protein SLEP1_g3834 [Rubroshorea leprosula]|uniref:NAC domain-containing protein n=1 Tax=Rubroshorea leprosula TaxID=152421 RepID=A0AAV5HLR8_9ROSI|nr:hypothetical protein SLEP1_g3834 [Rubroshorea leprosula]